MLPRHSWFSRSSSPCFNSRSSMACTVFQVTLKWPLKLPWGRWELPWVPVNPNWCGQLSGLSHRLWETQVCRKISAPCCIWWHVSRVRPTASLGPCTQKGSSVLWISPDTWPHCLQGLWEHGGVVWLTEPPNRGSQSCGTITWGALN